MTSTSDQAGNNDRNAKIWIYDVFLSFRGEDTRRNFTDHLYNALVDKRIRTFRDDEKVERGKVIKQEILKAIEESMISIVIFSKNFAFSRWCLEEVVKIIQCMKQLGQTVLPIFYDVDPSHVRNQTGSFGEAFAKFEGSKEKMETVQRWRDALSEAGNLCGWDLQYGHKYESKVIKEITELVLKRLNGTHSNHYKGNEGYEKMRSFDNSYVHKSWSGNVFCQISIPEGQRDIRLNHTCVLKPNPQGQRDIRLNHTCVFKPNPRSHAYGVEENVFSFSTNYVVEDIVGCKNQSPDLCVNIEASFTTSCPKGYKGVGRKWIKGRIEKLIKGSIGNPWSYLAHNKRKPKDKSFQRNKDSEVLPRVNKDSDKDSEVLPRLNKDSEVLPRVNKDLEVILLDLDVKRFTEEELKKATNNYDERMIIGEGGSGVVYKGILQSNSVVAVKRSIHTNEAHEIEQFVNEVVVLHRMKHINVVRLLGCCFDTEFPLLVYEYISNETLDQHILKESNKRPLLSWEMRLTIALQIARALSFLHYEASPPMIHRDVKPTNILLDENYMVKLTDFGLAKLHDNTLEVTMDIKGTFGYLDPEYLNEGKVSLKSDVYSFGVVLAQLLTGRKAIDMKPPNEERNLARDFCSCLAKNRLSEIVDSCLLHDKSIEEVAFLANRCLQNSGCNRPGMRKVVQELRVIMDRRYNKKEFSQRAVLRM